jgi:hypothetical protein
MRTLARYVVAPAFVVALALSATAAGAADHLDAPLVKTDGRTDITDVYAFQSPEDADNTVLVMNVNPLAGMMSGTTFDPKGQYVFNVDNNGDAQADVTVAATFGKPNSADAQRIKVKVANATVGMGDTGSTIELRRGGRAWAGVADDPFYFDLQAFNDLKSMLAGKGPGTGRTFCDANAVDFFAGTNVSSIVVELPSSALTRDGDPNIGVWGTTSSGNVVKDQMGRPAINTVFVTDERKDEFNATAPSDMLEAFGDLFRDDLVTLSGLDGTGYTPAQADELTSILLPDILTFDTSSSDGFLNGRGLADDVIDAELALVTGGQFGGSPVLTTDCIDANDATFPSSFPYLAPAH